MKCPYCNKELHCGAQLNSDGFIVELYQCSNPECEQTEFLVGCKEFWDILGQNKRRAETLDVIQEFITKWYLNGNITDEHLKRYKTELKKRIKNARHFDVH